MVSYATSSFTRTREVLEGGHESRRTGRRLPAEKIGLQLRAYVARILKERSAALGRFGEDRPLVKWIDHQGIPRQAPMTVELGLNLFAIGCALVLVIVREYRLQHRSGLTDTMVVMHAARMIAFLLVGFGGLGLVLDSAGFGGERPLVETLHFGLGFGFWPTAQTAYVEGATKLARVCWAAMAWGVRLWIACTLILWWCGRRKPPSLPAGA